jgi:hypothetical protein
MSAIRRLVYTSRVATASGVCSPESMKIILAASVRNNAIVGITGMLLGFKGYFLQALEGPATAVEMTFHRVEKDTRHGSVNVLSDEMTASRTFPNWAMCGKDLTDADNEILKVLSQRETYNPYAMSGRDAIKLLTLVHSIHLRTASLPKKIAVVEL